MQISSSLGSWSDAHVFYNHYEQPTTLGLYKKVAQAEVDWRHRLLHGSTNGALLGNNSLFESLRNDQKIYLLHVTTSLDRIIEPGALYPSAGCLVGGIYCTPLFREKNGLRLHNLGTYIFDVEAPRALKEQGISARPKPLIIEVEVPDNAYKGFAGIDYLRLGNIHLQIFRELEYLLSKHERYELHGRLVTKVRGCLDFLSICSREFYQNTFCETDTFFRLLSGSIPHLPILGYFYFEIIAEYLMLFSTGKMGEELTLRGEFNNWGYKELIFKLYPGLATNFNLGQFNPSIDQLEERLRILQQRGLANVDIQHLRDYVKERMVFLVCSRLLTAHVRLQDWHKITWEFDELVNYAGPLLGHLAHRELRNFGRYPDFYFYFDQYKALQIWNYWNHMDIMLPFNGVIPKGELGINPAYPKLRYNIYEGKIIHDAGTLMVEPGKQLNLAMVPRLIDLKYNFMRTTNGRH